MTKVAVVFLALIMLVQIIRPLGLPGLRRRADAWKLAVVAIVLFAVLAAMQPVIGV